MGYNSLDVIAGLSKQDKTTLGNHSKLLEYVRGNAATYPNGMSFGNNTVYSRRVASVVAVGLTYASNGKLVPQLFDLNASKFAETAAKSNRLDSYSNASKYFHEGQPYSSHYNKWLEQPGLNFTFAELTQMNGAIVSSRGPQYSGAMPYTDNMKKPSAVDYWTTAEQQYAGYDQSSVKSSYESKGITELTYLFYTISIIDEMQARYGYRMPDPTRPYSPYNWIKASDDGKPGLGCRYYKLLYLSEFDCLLHSGVINVPAYMTKQFVAGTMFDNMINSMTSYSQDTTQIGDANNKSSIHYLHMIHITILDQGEWLLAGQYVYSKDFAYKMHLRQNGELFVWQLPITANGLDTPLFTVLKPSDWSRSQNNFIGCVLSLQSDGNVVVYANPTVTSTYNGSNAPVMTISPSSGKPISATGTANNKFIMAGKKYSLMLLPGGAAVIVTGGGATDDSAVYTSGANSANFKYTDDKMDPDCVNNWDYSLNGSVASANNNIVSITKANDPKNWCYASPLVKATNYTNNAIQFTDASVQLIVTGYGLDRITSSNTYDVLYNLVTGAFMKQATSLGYKISANTANAIQMGYCWRGDRLVTDALCSSSLSTLMANTGWKNVIDYKMRNQICAPGYEDKYNTACAVVTPKLPIIADLVKMNPAFGVLTSAKTSATYNPYPDVDLGTLMANNKGYTTAQLDLLFGSISPSYHTKWQQLYATAAGVTPFPAVDFTASPIANAYNLAAIKQFPSTIVCFKTTSGLFMTSGEMNFPYVSTVTSYPALDKFWTRVLASGSISPKSKWSGPTFMPTTLNDIQTIVTNPDYTLLTSSLYDMTSISITGLAGTANAVVFIKSISIPKIVSYVKTLQPITPTELGNISSNCRVVPDACYKEASDYIASNSFDGISNAWCDIAVDSINNGSKNISYLNSSNANAMKQSCDLAYAKVNCALPQKRYASGFRNRPATYRPVQHGFESFTHMENINRESFTGTASCNTICATAPAASELYNACKTGSVEFCGTGTNIISDTCRKDAILYPEVQALLDKWCGNPANKSNASYQKYCPASTTSTSVSTPTVTTNATPSAINTQTSVPIVEVPSVTASVPIVDTSTSTPVIDTPSISAPVVPVTIPSGSVADTSIIGSPTNVTTASAPAVDVSTSSSISTIATTNPLPSTTGATTSSSTLGSTGSTTKITDSSPVRTSTASTTGTTVNPPVVLAPAAPATGTTTTSVAPGTFSGIFSGVLAGSGGTCNGGASSITNPSDSQKTEANHYNPDTITIVIGIIMGIIGMLIFACCIKGYMQFRVKPVSFTTMSDIDADDLVSLSVI